MSGEPPPRASSYTREIFQRLRRSTWEQRYVLGAVFLGQFLSLCLCGTGVTSQLLVTDYDISVPTTQCFLNYVLLGLTFGVHFATKKRFMRALKYNWWKYLILGVVDVEANFLMVLAYRYTNLTSIQLLDCFTILAVMVLSYVFLKTRYKLINIMGVLLTVIGIACLVFADFNSSRNKGGDAMFVGDMLCLVGAVLYAAGNVTQEYLVKSHTILEYLGFIGVVGSFVSGAQLIALERMNVARIDWNPSVGGLFSGFGVALFLFYSITPWVIRMSSAVVLNLSLLTADFYTLIFGLFLFDYRFSGFYIMGFCLVVLGIFIYNLKHPVEKKFRERGQERRRERSIERLFSVATTKVESSTETGEIRWKARGLLESSVTETASDCIGILSDSYKAKIPRYGGTSTEMKVATSLTLSRYNSYQEGPLPYWGGRNLRGDDRGERDHRGNGYHGRRDDAHVEIEAGSGSVRYSQSLPVGHSEEDVGRGGERGREGEPEGKEERRYSRQAGVGEEEEVRQWKERKRQERETLRTGQKKGRGSESSAEVQRSREEVSPANRKRRRRRSERTAASSRSKNSHSLVDRGKAGEEEEEEEEEEGFRLSSEELTQEKMVPVREREREGGGGGFN